MPAQRRASSRGERRTYHFLQAGGARWFSTDGKLPLAQCTNGPTEGGRSTRRNGGPFGTTQKGGPRLRRVTMPYIGVPMQPGSNGPGAQPPFFGTGGGEYQRAVRDGQPHFMIGSLDEPFMRKQAKAKDSLKHELMRA